MCICNLFIGGEALHALLVSCFILLLFLGERVKIELIQVSEECNGTKTSSLYTVIFLNLSPSSPPGSR